MAYRVIQWATGSMGKTCLRAVIDHPDLELAGLLVYSEEKNGRDAGEIAHRQLTGVYATKNIEDILAIDADVVIHAPRLQFPYHYHNKDICRLLASGKNVITINGHSFPAYHGAAYAAEFTTACLQGESTFFSTGLNPGFIMEKVAIMATGICTELESLYVSEVFDVSGIPNYDYVFNICGMGSDPEKFDLNLSGPVTELITGMYSETLALAAFRLGMELEQVEPDHSVILAPTDIRGRAGIVRAGTVAATNWCWYALVGGKRVITLEVNWVMGSSVSGFENRDHWKIAIRGKPGIDITINLVEPEDLMVKTKAEQYGVAGSVINSIPEVCTAPAGIYHFPLFAPYRARFHP